MEYHLTQRPEYRGYPLLILNTSQGPGSDRPHGHDFMEIGLVHSGSAIHCAYKEETVFDSSSMIRGDLYVMLPGEIHQFTEKRDLGIYVIAFSSELLIREKSSMLRTLPLLRSLLDCGTLPSRRLHLLPMEFAHAERLLHRISMELNQGEGQDHHWLSAKINLLEFLITIGRHSPEEWKRAGGIVDNRILEAISEMETHPELPWSIPDLARKYSMCESGFSRKFKAAVGLPPIEYCLELKLLR